MFCFVISKIIVIFILLLSKDMYTIALNIRFTDMGYETKNQYRGELYPINKELFEEKDYGLKQNEFMDTIPFKFKKPDKDFEASNYDYNYPDFKALRIRHPSDQIHRREASSKGAYAETLQNTSLYPSVLTKAVEISLNSSAPINAGESLFSNVAQKMNASALGLAKLLTKTKNSNDDDQFSQIIENYKRNKAQLILDISNPSTMTFMSSPRQNLPNNVQYKSQANNKQIDEQVEGYETSNLAAILDHVLNKLESIQRIKNDEEEEHPDGVPCDIIGSWSSTSLGICFDMQFHKDKNRFIPPAEINNKVLSINISECIPAKHHQIFDMEWKFTGSAIKQWGGPFYLYGQKRSESVVATFLGFCRTCNGIDTIFGSWNILSPTKDCHDVSLGNEVKQDIIRRVRMEIKRKERFKDLLYKNRHEKL